MSKRKIAKRLVALGLKIGKYAKIEVEKEAKVIMKDKFADKKRVKIVARKIIAEAGKMKSKLEAYAKAEMKRTSKPARKKKK